MNRKYAILIDAAFLKKVIGSKESPAEVGHIIDFTEKIKSQLESSAKVLHRIYYYDAEPFTGEKLKPLTGGSQNGEKINFSTESPFIANKSMLSELKRKSNFAVRLGELAYRGWKVKPQLLDSKNTAENVTVTAEDIIPDLQQKGVDMRIGLDITTLTLKNQVDIIVLITGDSDFIPAMKLARREGKQVILFTLGKRVRDEVYAHTDICIEKSVDEL